MRGLAERCLEQAGREERASRFDAAIAALAPALAAEPRRAELWARRGLLRMAQKDYDGAGADLNRAAALDARLKAARGRWHFVQGRFSAAARDLAGARGEEDKRLRGVARVLSGRPAAGRGSGPWLKGYALMAKGRYEAAARAFARSGRKEWTAKLYASLARGMAIAPKPGPRGARHILLCGLGLRWPAEITLEALAELSACDVVFCNIPGEEIVETLGLFCRELRPFSFRTQEDVERCVRILVREAESGRKVGFATNGHALFFGPLATEVIRRCEARGIAHRVVSSVSSFDSILSRMSLSFGYAFGGVQAVAAAEAMAPEFAANPRLATLIHVDEMPAERAARFLGALRRRFPARRDALLFFGGRDSAPVRATVGALAGHLDRMAGGCQLFIPAARGVRREHGTPS